MRPVGRIHDWVVSLYKLDSYYVIVIFRMKFIFGHASVGGKVSVLISRSQLDHHFHHFKDWIKLIILVKYKQGECKHKLLKVEVTDLIELLLPQDQRW